MRRCTSTACPRPPQSEWCVMRCPPHQRLRSWSASRITALMRPMRTSAPSCPAPSSEAPATAATSNHSPPNSRPPETRRPRPMDINALFEKNGMRDFTAEQRDTFMNDGQQIRQMQRIVQARLAQISLEGDRPGAAGRRARKMAKRFGKLAGLLEKAAAQCEAINTAYVHDIL